MYTLNGAKEELLLAFVSYRSKEPGYDWYMLDERFHLPFCLVAPEGTGKRTIAKAVAEEMRVSFFENKVPDSELDKAGVLYLESDGYPLIDGGIVYPKNWLVILGLTPEEYDFDLEVGNIRKDLKKMRVIKISTSLKEFLSYLEEEHEETIIAEYLVKNPNMAYVYNEYTLGDVFTNELPDQYAAVTYRDWDNLGRTIEYRMRCGGIVDYKFISQFIKNKEVALNFADYYKKTLAKKDIEKVHYMLEKPDGFGEIVEKYIECEDEKKYSMACAMTVYLENKALELQNSSENEDTQADIEEKMMDISKAVDAFMEFFDYVDRWGKDYKEMIYDCVSNNVDLIASVMTFGSQQYEAFEKN